MYTVLLERFINVLFRIRKKKSYFSNVKVLTIIRKKVDVQNNNFLKHSLQHWSYWKNNLKSFLYKETFRSIDIDLRFTCVLECYKRS